MAEKKRWPREAWLDAMWDDASALTPNARVVAYAYGRYAKSGDVTWCPYPELMRRTGITRRAAVSAAIKALVEAGWLTVVEHARGRRSTRFRLTLPAASGSDVELLDGRPDGRSRSGSERLDAGSSSTSEPPTAVAVPLLPRSSSISELDLYEKESGDDRNESHRRSSSVTRTREDGQTTAIIDIFTEHTNAKPHGELDSPEWRAGFVEWLGDLAAEPIRNIARYLQAAADDGSLQDRLDEYRGEKDYLEFETRRDVFRRAMQTEPACEHGYPGGHIRDEAGWMICPIKRNAESNWPPF
jgi:hypothetical protein